MDIIERDIGRLEQEIQARRDSIKTLRLGINDLRGEQDELRALLSSTTEYSKDDLEKNIKRLDFHIGQVEATIEKERAGIDQLAYMIKVLRKKQCQSETTSPSTGTPPLE
jgi:septal ring factor EnvC (AmiA/AmiB activator)